MRYTVLIIALAAAGLTACSSNSAISPEAETDAQNQIAAGKVQVSVGKRAYSPADLGPSGVGVNATLNNSADQTFYSKLGDAFNSAAEQNPLSVSNGSDATLEREEGARWVAVQTPQMIEGVKAVELRPGKSYELVARASAAVPTGRYRIVVAYRSAASDEVTARATSAVFDVR
jgi:hypothetical protein